MSQTIFAQIIAGTLPCHKIYEDEQTLAFLNINPVQPGHTLVIPKTAAEFVWDLDPNTYAALMTTVQKVAHRLRQVLSTSYVGEKIVGVDVPHAHVHLIPFSEISEFEQEPKPGAPDHAGLAAMAKSLAF